MGTSICKIVNSFLGAPIELASPQLNSKRFNGVNISPGKHSTPVGSSGPTGEAGQGGPKDYHENAESKLYVNRYHRAKRTRLR